MPKRRTNGFSLAMMLIGIVLTMGTAWLAGRLIWEMTSLTWRLGPQMIGFSLAHGPLAMLLLFPLALAIWILVFGCIVLIWKIRKRTVLRASYATLLGAALVLGILLLPHAFWDRVFVGQLVKSPHCAELFVYAAVTGERNTVEAMLERGIPVGARDTEGNTALHMASVRGDAQLAAYLLRKGADPNAVNLYGDSPLEKAMASHHQEVISILVASGGKDLKGDDARRQKATEEIVRHDIERMDSNRK